MIYFLHDVNADAIKVGYTANVDTYRKRMSELQVGNPRPLSVLFVIPGDRELEKKIHKHFAAHKITGEWFRSSFFVVTTLMAIYRKAKKYDPDVDLIA